MYNSRLADAVVDALESNGLLDRQYDKVKLHATLMNSRFAVNEDEAEGIKLAFNAKPILEVVSFHPPASFRFLTKCAFKQNQKFKGYDFGTVLIDSLHLSERYSTSPSTKYYMATAEIKLAQ